MKFMHKISHRLIVLIVLLNTSVNLYAFTPPEGYQGRFLVPRTLLLQPGITNPEISPSFGNPGFFNNITQQEGLASAFMNWKSTCAIASTHFKTISRAITNVSQWRANPTPVV